MSQQITQLERLESELRQVDEELARAARPLEALDELDLEQRKQLAGSIRAALARWESLTREIRRAMGAMAPGRK